MSSPLAPAASLTTGAASPMELSVGDKVIYSKYAGTEYEDGDEEYLIMRESDVLANSVNSPITIRTHPTEENRNARKEDDIR